MTNKMIQLKKIKSPILFKNVAPVFLTDETMLERKNKILSQMNEDGYDALIIYADLEHGSNFEYLTGFVPRFEEGLLILDKTGKATLILGNENLKMATFSRIDASLKHSPYFSLPNQPFDHKKTLETLLSETDISSKNKIGLVGWKMFVIDGKVCKNLFDFPYFIIESIKNSITKNSLLENATHLFISGHQGARVTNNENEIAHYEYGANLASNCMLTAMNALEVGMLETEIGGLLSAEGQHQTVVTIAASGQRFEKANFYPTYKKIEHGKPLSLTTGFKGGLSSRTGFVIANEDELPSDQKDYLERIAKPYFAAITAWLENIKIGMTGGEMYSIIENAFDKKRYGWHLNPGHLCADEEWMSSPIYPCSKEILKNGMILQIDIIPSVKGYSGVSAEEGIALANKELQSKIQSDYPDLWNRISMRRDYIKTALNINITDDVIPLSNTVAYLRPFLLAKGTCLTYAYI